MKGSPCCTGLMWSCLHTYRTKTNLTQHIIQPWGDIRQVWVGGVINQLWGGHQPSMGGHQSSMGGHQPSMGGHQSSMGGSSSKYGGVINQLWGAISQVWGVSIFPPVCTGTQNPENYFSNTYVLPSVNRTAGPTMVNWCSWNYVTPVVNTYCWLQIP